MAYYRIFIRRDQRSDLGTLPNINKTPAEFMNYDGKNSYENSGFLALFEYKFNQKKEVGNRGRLIPKASAAIENLSGSFIHILLLPSLSITEIRLDETNVRNNIEKTDRNPTIYNTDECAPYSAKYEDGTVKLADRYCNEFLFTGNYPLNSLIHTHGTNDRGGIFWKYMYDNPIDENELLNIIFYREICGVDYFEFNSDDTKQLGDKLKGENKKILAKKQKTDLNQNTVAG